jgi:all-trans-8'-apo-beta-carotenal 15,15'-oxygenase
MTVFPPQPDLSLERYDPKDWQGGTESLLQEFDYLIDSIEGEIPADLQGTLFRNGPGLLQVGDLPLKHPFDGDGMVCAIAFDQGQAHFRNRYVRTEGYLAEQAAGTILFRGVFGTPKPGGWLRNAFDLKFKNIANTGVLYWGDKLLALWEGGRPHRLEPATLATLGEESFQGVLQPGDAFSAHPRIDPGDAERPPRLVNFAIKPGLSTQITIYELDPAGQVVEQQQHQVPGFAFIHDFALTANYCIFFQNPVQFNPLPFLLGVRSPGECIQFQSQQPTRIWLIPRHGQGQIRCLDTQSCFVFHHANAYEQENEIIVDSICYDRFPSLEPDQDFRQIDFATLPPGQLFRFRIDLERQSVKRTLLDPRCAEFPAVHPAYGGQAYRYVYLAIADPAEGNAPLQALLKLDLTTGVQKIWRAGPRGFMGEPIFVPAGNSTAENLSHQDCEEAGWILALVYDASHHRSDLVILNASSFQLQARLHLKHHLPYGLHGSYTPKLWTLIPPSTEET